MTKASSIWTIKLFLVISFLFFSASPCLGAKKRVRKQKDSGSYISKGVASSVRFRPDRLGLLINFSNFDNLVSGRYELVYQADGITQGAGGSIILGDTSTKEILFGTCSGGVCHFHDNITDARLSIISELKDGTTVLKPYRIKV
jgi:hypothetical protein